MDQRRGHKHYLFKKVGGKWIKEGDIKTTYFHGKVNVRRRTNISMLQLGEDNTWIEDPLTIHEVAVNFYMNLPLEIQKKKTLSF